MNNGYEHASQYQLFLCAYPHGKRVMPLACERVITCRVRVFTLFLEIPWRVTFKAYNKLQIHPNVQTNVSEPEPENISTEPIMDILNSIANREGLSSSDVEDWLNVNFATIVL